MREPRLNLDSTRRDTLIFGEPLDWSGHEAIKRRATFDQLQVQQLEQLIAQAFVEGDDRQNLWITPQDLIAYARSPALKALNCYFESYHPQCGGKLLRSVAFGFKALFLVDCAKRFMSGLNLLERSSFLQFDCEQLGGGECKPSILNSSSKPDADESIESLPDCWTTRSPNLRRY